MKLPELSKQSDGIKFFMPRAKPTAAEAPEVDLVAEELVSRDFALPRKVAVSAKFKIQNSNLHSLWT